MFFLILCFYFAHADYNIVCISLAAPKKVPMLKYTIDYFLNAYNFNHEGINIDEFILAKGVATDQALSNSFIFV